MTRRSRATSIERHVLVAFRRAYAEEAFAVADLLLEALELMERQRNGLACADLPGETSTLAEAYRMILDDPPRRNGKH